MKYVLVPVLALLGAGCADIVEPVCMPQPDETAGFALVPRVQDTDHWCYAATAAVIAETMGLGVRSDCQMASVQAAALAKSDVPADVCCAEGLLFDAYCQRGGRTDDVLAQAFPGALRSERIVGLETAERIKTELSSGHFVTLILRANTGKGGHIVTVAAYRGDVYTYFDTYAPGCELTYQELSHGCAGSPWSDYRVAYTMIFAPAGDQQSYCGP